MTFANPILAFAGLACVAVPILIHILLRRRRKPIAWGAMEFLRQAYRQQRRRTRLEQILLLASRCLIVALIALALGKPLLAGTDPAEAARARTLYIILDNSLQSQVTEPGGATSALARAVQDAGSLLDSLDPARSDRAGLLLAGGPARGVVLPPSSDIAEVRRLLEQVDSVDSKADVSGAVELIRAAMGSTQSGPRDRDAITIALLGPARAGSLALATPLPTTGSADPTRPVRWITNSPEGLRELSNVAITQLQPVQSLLLGDDGQPLALGVRVGLSRFGPPPPGPTRVRAWLAPASASGPLPPSQARVREGVIAWNPGQERATLTLSLDAPQDYRPGKDDALVAVARIDEDAIAGDNALSLAIDARAGLTIALLGAAPDASAGLDTLDPREWLALALTPVERSAWEAQTRGIRLERIDARDIAGAASDAGPAQPASAPPALLRGMDAIVITQPATLDEAAWRGIARAAASRAMVMIIPPHDAPSAAGADVAAWLDTAAQALGLPWRAGDAGVRELAAPHDALAHTTQTSDDADLLSLLRPELEDLTRSVHVRRLVELAPDSFTPSQVLLRTQQELPVLLASRSQSSANTGAAPGPWVVLWLTAPALEWTDLPAKPLMVPLVQELLREGVGRSSARTLAIAGSAAASAAQAPGAVDAVPLWLARDAQRSQASPVPLRTAGPQGAQSPGAGPGQGLASAGLWALRSESGQRITTLSVQADPGASDTTPVEPASLLRWLEATGAPARFLDTPSAPRADQSTAGGPPLRTRRDADARWSWSFWLLAAALALGVTEAWMARRFSHAYADEPRTSSSRTGGAAP